LNHFTVPCSFTDFSLFLGYLVSLERPQPKTKKGRELCRLAAPLNESKGLYKSNKRKFIIS